MKVFCILDKIDHIISYLFVHILYSYLFKYLRFYFFRDPNCEELGVIWENDSKSNPCFMDIGTSWVMKKGTPFAERVEFWNKLAAKYSIC